MEMIYMASKVKEYESQGENNTSKFSDYGQQSKWATAAVVLRLLQRSELVDVRSKV